MRGFDGREAYFAHSVTKWRERVTCNRALHYPFEDFVWKAIKHWCGEKPGLTVGHRHKPVDSILGLFVALVLFVCMYEKFFDSASAS